MIKAANSLSLDRTEEKMPKKFTLILVMGLLTSIGPLSTDMYLPAFPSIARTMHTTVSEVALSLSSFFIGISAGQLLYGPLLERFGRKKPLYAGLLLYFLASLGCALSKSVQALIVLRLFQAIGGCVGLVAARAMVRDLFHPKQNAQVFSMLMLVVAISPIIAPTLGGFISAAFGWRFVFVVLMIVVVVILLGTYFFLPETKKPDPTFSLKPLPILRNFGSVLSNRQFITYALTGSISYGGLYAYVGGSAHVFMELHHLTESQFGIVFSIIAAGIIGASQLNSLALKKYSSEEIIRVASICQTVGSLALVILGLTIGLHLYVLIFLIFINLACQGFIFPNTTALALAPLGHNAGNASALVGAIQMSIGASAAAVVSVFHQQSSVPMTMVMCGCAVTALLVYLGARRFWLHDQQVLTAGELDMSASLLE